MAMKEVNFTAAQWQVEVNKIVDNTRDALVEELCNTVIDAINLKKEFVSISDTSEYLVTFVNDKLEPLGFEVVRVGDRDQFDLILMRIKMLPEEEDHAP